MTDYCIAPVRVGICGKKLPCKSHPDQSDYENPDPSVCLHVRAGSGAPGVCGTANCTKHEAKPVSKAPTPADQHKRKRVIKVKGGEAVDPEPPKKRSKVLDANDNSYSKSVSSDSSDSSDSSESSESSDSSSESVMKKKSRSKSKSKSKKHHSKRSKPRIPLELAPPKTTILDSYAEIQKEQQKLLKQQLAHSKLISRMIAAKHNNSDSSESSASD